MHNVRKHAHGPVGSAGSGGSMTLVGTSSAGLTEWLLDRIALPIAIATAVTAKECRERGIVRYLLALPTHLMPFRIVW